MYVIDSYALLSWFVEDNQKYKPYFEKIVKKNKGIISELVLLEVYHRVFHMKGERQADLIFSVINGEFRIEKLTMQRIKKTGKKRSELLKIKKKLSYADCLNLVLAQEFGAKVLTGGEDFRDVKHTEFVK